MVGLGNVNNVASYSTSQADTAITNQINSLIDAAPGALNTLNELAAALGDDADYAVTTTALIGTKQDTITDGDLTIARTNGLQASLDAKMAGTTTVISAGQASAISANTDKISYTGAAQVATNVSAIASNTDKVTYDGAVQVAANVTAIGLNTSKLTFPTASNMLLHTTHADLHTSHTNTLNTHTTQIAEKAPAIAPTFSGTSSFTGGTVHQPSANTAIPLQINNNFHNQYSLDVYSFNHGARIMSKTTNSNTSVFEVRTNNYNNIDLKVKGNGETEIARLKTQGAVYRNVSGSITDNYTVTSSDYIIRVIMGAPSKSISLPAVSGQNGRVLIISNIAPDSGGQPFTIDPNGSETIDEASTLTVIKQKTYMIYCDGTEWWSNKND